VWVSRPAMGGPRALGRRSAVCLTCWCVCYVEAELDLEEAAAFTYFGKTMPHGVPQSVERYSDLTSEEFEDLALRGRPFVVENGNEGQPFVGWTCDRFRKEYPNGVVKMEYANNANNPYWKITDPWDEKKHQIPNSDPNGPQYAPWYWGVKGSYDPEEARTIFRGGSNPLPKVQASMRLPPWMPSSTENQQEIFGSPEFWFSAPGAGASMHMDSHCESTYAIQLYGKRRWRIGWIPRVPNGTVYKNGVYADGVIYGKGYQPPLEATVEKGQGFFMPSAFLHETNNIGNECAVSLTFQFRDPMPARYFRASLRHLRRSGDFNECWKLVGSVAALGQKPRKGQGPGLASVDRDGDGKLSRAEASTKILRAGHAFHDLDQDGFVSEAELKHGWTDWVEAEREARDKSAQKIRPQSYSYLHWDEL